MKLKLTRIFLAAALMTGIGGVAAAAGEEKLDPGKREFEATCAACHGNRGEGNGSYAQYLNSPVPNLTVLSKDNGGVFPYAYAYAIIDGRQLIKGHGQDMPIWGLRYTVEAAPIYDDYRYNAEVFVRSRVLSLIDYLNRLQVK